MPTKQHIQTHKKMRREKNEKEENIAEKMLNAQATKAQKIFLISNTVVSLYFTYGPEISIAEYNPSASLYVQNQEKKLENIK